MSAFSITQKMDKITNDLLALNREFKPLKEYVKETQRFLDTNSRDQMTSFSINSLKDRLQGVMRDIAENNWMINHVISSGEPQSRKARGWSDRNTRLQQIALKLKHSLETDF